MVCQHSAREACFYIPLTLTGAITLLNNLRWRQPAFLSFIVAYTASIRVLLGLLLTANGITLFYHFPGMSRCFDKAILNKRYLRYYQKDKQYALIL